LCKKNIDISFYTLISKIKFLKSYCNKILLISIFAIQLPLLALIIYFVLYSNAPYELKIQILLITLSASILGGVITLYFIRQLLSPVALTSHELRNYIESKKLTNLPIDYSDEIGKLMADIQYTVMHTDKLIKSLEKTAMMDYLTDVYNRFTGEKRLREDINRSVRSKEDMTIALVDLDNLKGLNDLYGHYTGDICLQKLVEIIKDNIRESDWISRWGGDEFLVVLFSSNIDYSKSVFDRISKSLENLVIPTGMGDLRLSIGVGLNQYNGQDTEKELFRKADTALLEAKRRGESQIVSWNEINEQYKDMAI